MENSTEHKNLFEKLKEIRIEKGIRFETITEKSRIQVKYLQALEEGDLLSIPEVYDKLFFRSYLKALSVEDEEVYFEEFLNIRREIRVDKTTTTIQISESAKDTDKKIFSNRNLFVIMPVVLIIVVLAFLLINTEMIGTSSEGKVQEIDIKNVVQRIEAKEQAKFDSLRLAEQLKLDSLNMLKPDSLGLALRINAKRKTWFRIIADKSDTSEYLLNPGQNVTASANRTFEFLIGRADGLIFNLNGKVLNKTGTDSSVVRYMRIDSSGIAVKILKKENTDEVNSASL
ncbi:MAG: RodZ domain-containing protein [Calditrichia bacterium]